MIAALIIFICIYILMLAFQKFRPYIALGGALIFVVLGLCGVYEFTPLDALGAIDFNVLLLIAGTMGIVTLFIESKMPLLMSEWLISKMPNVKWAVVVLSLFAGVVSAFVDNVATVLMIAPIGLAISKKLDISPVPVLISIAVSSNLQGAATLVGDTTSFMLASRDAADMNFVEFFWMDGKPSIFWGVELGAIVSALIMLWLFRKEKQPIDAKVETKVTDYVPTVLLVGVVLCLALISFVPAPEGNPVLETLYDLRNGLVCVVLCIIGVVYHCIRHKTLGMIKQVFADIDRDTILLLVGLFVIIGGITEAGVIDAFAGLIQTATGDNAFLFYSIIVFASVLFSAFVDNIPYVATMIPVVAAVASGMGIADPTVFYFGLLTGATLGGNLTPIGASANIAAIGILRKNGETVKVKDFLRIGVPFTLAAVLAGYAYIWLVWGI